MAPAEGAIVLRDAEMGERAALEQLQRRASLHNPGDRAALLAHPDAVVLPAWQIEHRLVRVAEQDRAVAGFAVLLAPEDGACELDGLFVEPERMRAGVGRLLVADAKRIARARGAAAIGVVANAHALGFYERLGFTGAEEVHTRFGSGLRMRLDLGAR